MVATVAAVAASPSSSLSSMWKRTRIWLHPRCASSSICCDVLLCCVLPRQFSLFSLSSSRALSHPFIWSRWYCNRLKVFCSFIILCNAAIHIRSVERLVFIQFHSRMLRQFHPIHNNIQQRPGSADAWHTRCTFLFLQLCLLSAQKVEQSFRCFAMVSSMPRHAPCHGWTITKPTPKKIVLANWSSLNGNDDDNKRKLTKDVVGGHIQCELPKNTENKMKNGKSEKRRERLRERRAVGRRRTKLHLKKREKSGMRMKHIWLPTLLPANDCDFFLSFHLSHRRQK